MGTLKQILSRNNFEALKRALAEDLWLERDEIVDSINGFELIDLTPECFNIVVSHKEGLSYHVVEKDKLNQELRLYNNIRRKNIIGGL